MVKINKYLILILIVVLSSVSIYYIPSVKNKERLKKEVPFVNLKLNNKTVSFDKKGDLIKYEEIPGLPEIDVRGKTLRRHYDSIKELSLVFPNIQDLVKENHFKLVMDLEKDTLILKGKSFEALIGDKNIKKRIENVATLLKGKEVKGFIDASFDNIVVVGK